MSSQMSEQEIYEAARKRVEEKKGFYVHFIVYVIVNAVLVIIWAVNDRSSGGIPWFIYPLGGWGVGLIFHFLGVFFFNNSTGWERRQVEKEAEKLRRDNRAND